MYGGNKFLSKMLFFYASISVLHCYSHKDENCKNKGAGLFKEFEILSKSWKGNEKQYFYRISEAKIVRPKFFDLVMAINASKTEAIQTILSTQK